MSLKLPRRQSQALLAGGLVLGLGAAATLAAWTDSVHLSAVFSSSTFGIELNVDGEWNDIREMTFNGAGMYPGAVVYAPVLIRTTPETTLDAELTLAGQGRHAGAATIVDALTYRVVTHTVPREAQAPGCSAAQFTSNAIYVLGSFTDRIAMREPITANNSQSIAATSGDYAVYCFEVTLPATAPGSMQGTQAQHTWTWDAVSLSSETEI